MKGVARQGVQVALVDFGPPGQAQMSIGSASTCGALRTTCTSDLADMVRQVVRYLDHRAAFVTGLRAATAPYLSHAALWDRQCMIIGGHQ